MATHIAAWRPYTKTAATPLPKTASTPSVTVLIPTLNEAENLPFVLPRIPEWVDEVLIVDGYSTDNTIEVARALRPDVRIVMQEGKGKGGALRTGFRVATGKIIVTVDADGSIDPAEIPLFVGALLSGADYAKGSRFIQGARTVDMPLIRRLGNDALVILTNLLFGTHFSDLTYGYNATWRYCVPFLALEIDDWSNESMNNIRAVVSGLRVVEVPCFEHKRVLGDAKLKAFPAGWQILKAIVRERFVKRRRRIIWESRDVVGDDVFAPAMQLLRQEVLQLANERNRLAPHIYQRAVEAAKATYLALLDLQTKHPDADELKKNYRKEFAELWEAFDTTLPSQEPVSVV